MTLGKSHLSTLSQKPVKVCVARRELYAVRPYRFRGLWFRFLVGQKDAPSVGMTNLTTYDNKTSSKNIHTHAKPGSAFFLYLTQPGSTMKGVLGL
jgi:hypothetical protein